MSAFTITADDDLTELDVTLRRYDAPDRGVGDRGDFDFTATGPDGAPWELSGTEQERAVAACEGMRER